MSPAAGPVRRMTCSCCGSYAGHFAQHANRDTGYGMCRPCIEWVQKPRGKHQLGETAAELLDLYGIEGTHYATQEQWHEIQNRN